MTGEWQRGTTSTGLDSTVVVITTIIITTVIIIIALRVVVALVQVKGDIMLIPYNDGLYNCLQNQVK